ncbi:MAG: pyrroline-5-carboxylate reductase [Leptolyngbyaceae cyanobacterium bins.302]|nr:pyrroline-5-carboxylate reductase [Leptolyngbyaceae cyanobacterium bins.302]
MMKFGMIGGGMMGEALISRLLAQGIYAAQDAIVSDPVAERREYLFMTYGVQVTADNEAVAIADTVLLAIKPQVFDPVTQALAATLAQHSAPTLVLSILAGTPLAKLEAAFPHRAVIRAMPNTPATVGAGMTAIAPGSQVQPEQIEQAQRIFQAVGEVVQVPESLMDAVTGLSGSGPGYIALVIEALTDGGVAVGLPRAIAAKLAVQTVKGSAQLLQEKDLHPAVLKDQVTSPGGTTIAGIAHLEQSGFRSALIEAVRAAYLRSQELGQ